MRIFSLIAALALLVCFMTPVAQAEMTDMPVVRLQSLDKITARTMTFDARVGSTIKFGPLYIRIQSCRKAPPMEQPEAASFLQIWEIDLKTDEPEWLFSGWMFASSPGLSAMNHPVYDVWVIDCLPGKDGEETIENTEKKEQKNSSKQDEAIENKIEKEILTD